MTARVSMATFVVTSVASLFCSAMPSLGFERPTHRELSISAYAASLLQDATPFEAIGLEDDVLLPSESLPRGIGRPQDLVEEGADQEDDLSPLLRVVHHFFDPHAERPLTLCFLPCAIPGLCGTIPPTCSTSVDWALEDEQTITAQKFSFRDARDHLRTGLTAATEDQRREKLGRMFETLGHVIHHVQDMAQPQHTRNEQHAIPSSRFEYFADQQRVGGVLFKDKDGAPLPAYAPVEIDLATQTARAFWLTGSLGIGGGMAEYSSSNFVTRKTNLRGSLTSPSSNPEFPAPVAADATPVPMTWQELKAGHYVPESGFPLPQPDPDGVLYLMRFPVVDRLRPVTNPTFISSYSIYDADLDSVGQPRFTVNRINMNESLSLLIPRAVGYSAGLLNYFFRTIARVETDARGGTTIVPVMRLYAVDLGSGQGTLEVTNTSSEPWGGGTLSVYFDDRATGRRKQALSVTVTVPPGDSVMLDAGTALQRLITEGSGTGEVAVVYAGPVGLEQHSVAARVCGCPATPVTDLMDPAADCRGLCACEYVALTGGEAGAPGVAGDGVAVAPALSGFQTFLYDDQGNIVVDENDEPVLVTHYSAHAVVDRATSAVAERNLPTGMTVVAVPTLWRSGSALPRRRTAMSGRRTKRWRPQRTTHRCWPVPRPMRPGARCTACWG